MKVPGANRATQRAADTGIITQAGVVCDDCGELLSDWIIDFDGSTLCLPCADHWEPYHLDEGATA
jgi:formylmethanofuran dehydrogenase subunit E